MATVNAQAAGERTLGSGGALGEAFQQVMQGLSLIQEAVQQQERRTEESLREMARAMRETSAEHERRLQEERRTTEAALAREEAARRAVTSALEDKLRRVEERMEALESRSPLSGEGERCQASAAIERLAHLESRLEQLEASTERALQSVLPRVDELLNQLKKPSPPVTAPTPSSTSSSTSTSGATSAPSALSSASASSPAPRPRSPSVGSAATPSLSSERQEELGEQLLDATEDGREAEVRRLLDEGANVNYASSLRETPLMRACYSAHANIVSLLIGRGGDVNAKHIGGWTALHRTSFFDRSGRCTSLLIGAGALVDSADNDGQTPLHFAAGMRNEAAARVLLAAGASKSVRDKYGKTPSQRAVTDHLRVLLRP